MAADFDAGLDLLEAVGYTEVSLFLARQRHGVPIAGARASLGQVGGGRVRR